MGLSDLFSPNANLKGITETDNLFVSEVIQKTFINVHENGTEAAAATGRTLTPEYSSDLFNVFSGAAIRHLQISLKCI